MPRQRQSAVSRVRQPGHAGEFVLPREPQTARRPTGVLHWHAERVAKQQRAAALATAAPDAASATVAKRAQPRERRVAAGLAECDRWLRDVTRLGFAHARVQPAAFWEARAARLVDAQCPGVARRVRALAGIIVSGPRWEDRALTALGEIPLL